MASDSDRTTAELERQGQEQRAAAQRRDERWQSPPEATPVRMQRELNDNYGRRFSPWRK